MHTLGTSHSCKLDHSCSHVPISDDRASTHGTVHSASTFELRASTLRRGTHGGTAVGARARRPPRTNHASSTPSRFRFSPLRHEKARRSPQSATRPRLPTPSPPCPWLTPWPARWVTLHEEPDLLQVLIDAEAHRVRGPRAKEDGRELPAAAPPAGRPCGRRGR